MATLNIIFPVAGDGTRFGGQFFKPFLDATEKKFIEMAKEPFHIFQQTHKLVFNFIYRQDQEEHYDVQKNLEKLFPNDTLRCIILKEKTKGPLETVMVGIEQGGISGLSFVCDCDMSIQVKPFLSLLETNKVPDITVPVWKIQENEHPSWAKVKLSPNNDLLAYHEKEVIPASPYYKVKGIIGCYLFKNIEILSDFESKEGNFTEVFKEAPQKNISVDFLEIKDAEFFGTPEQLTTFRFNRAKRYTYFVDIDGTLLYLPKHVPYEASDCQLLPGSIEKLEEWKSKGHRIILTTGRETARREKLQKLLSDLKVPYDELITGTNSGTRVLINDKKPYCPFHKMAIAVQLPRNLGIQNVNIEDTPELISTLKGGSFASVYLIRKNNTLIVRKYLEKTIDNQVHYETLKRQVDDLRRFNYYSPGSVPKILDVYESPDEYYYDMEYLDHYDELVKFPFSKVEQKLPNIIQRLKNDVYCYRKKINGVEWLKEFLKEKIFAKYEMIENIDEKFYRMVNNDWITINNKKMKGLRYFFKTEKLRHYPEYVSPIHGDLTLENILYNPITDDFKLIDQSGARYVDPYDFDVAKLLQSLLAKYSEWDTMSSLCECKDDTSYTVNERMLDMDENKYKFMLKEFEQDTKQVFERGVFYLAMYLIRMIPFLIKKSKAHAHTGLLLALYYLNTTR